VGAIRRALHGLESWMIGHGSLPARRWPLALLGTRREMADRRQESISRAFGGELTLN
jgi:hypothetical protein